MQRDPGDELVRIGHIDLESTTVPRRSFDEMWEGEGWYLVGPLEDDASGVAGHTVRSVDELTVTELRTLADHRSVVHEPGDSKASLIAKLNGEQVAAGFDPSAHTVADVNAYLATADDDEAERVLEAELNGQARKGIIGDRS